MEKKCPQCKKIKIWEIDFPKNKRTKSGKHYWCLECCRLYNKKTYKKNKKYYIEKSAIYSKNNNFKYQRLWVKNNLIKSKYISLKYRCKINNIPIITKEEFIKWYNSQSKNCFYCGILEADFRQKNIMGRTGKYLTIDRLDSKKGYVIGNIVLACAICNIIKSNFFTPKEMKEIAEKYIKPKWLLCSHQPQCLK